MAHYPSFTVVHRLVVINLARGARRFTLSCAPQLKRAGGGGVLAGWVCSASFSLEGSTTDGGSLIEQVQSHSNHIAIT
eukprot:4652516-Prymnesium_polylepis.1